MTAHGTADISSPADPHAAGPHAAGHHVASMPVLLLTFGALLVLTVITWAVAYVDLGEFNLFVALAIATLKASLVALFFMGLLHDSGFNRLAFFGSFVFVLLFVGITLMDSGQYQKQLDWKERVLPEAPAAEAPK